MRLLKCTQPRRANHPATFSLTEFPTSRIPAIYAILSHRWTSDEVTLKDLYDGTGATKESYRKLEFCAEKAAEDGILYFWVDTCCINKESSAELSEAINSMFKWYKNATRCYVYMSDVSVPDQRYVDETQDQWIATFRSSAWFTRGWTLQELIAPAIVEFFSREGSRIGDKVSFEQDIHQVTGLPVEVLRGSPLADFDEQERLTWAAKRATTVEEDAAYCLLGLFDVHMPLIYGEGRQKAMDRLRREIQFSNNDAQFLTVPWIVPFERNTRFTGREEELEALERQLFTRDRTSRWAVVGLGGIGKTQLVIELLYRVRQKHRDCVVLWIPAISNEGLHQSCVSVAQQLNLPKCDDFNVDAIELIRDYLSSMSSGRWLLVFDNADDIEMWTTSQMPEHAIPGQSRQQRLIDRLPQNKRGCIVFTTRDRKAATTLAGSNVIAMSAMGRDTAVRMLRRCLIKPLIGQSEIMTELVAELAYLPLAIVQASAYINRNGCNLAEYLELLGDKEEEVVELLSEDFEAEGRYYSVKNPVATTWLISFEQLQKYHPLATTYLSFMACIHYRGIPQVVLPPGPSRWKEVEAIGTLTAYSFVERRGTESVLDLHRLVYLSTRNWLRKENLLEVWQQKALTRLELIFPKANHENRSTWRTYLPHAQAAMASSPESVVKERKQLIQSCAICLCNDGRWNESEALLSRILVDQKTVSDRGSTFDLVTIGWLVELYRNQGRLEKAEDLQVRLVESYKKKFGDDHVETLACIDNLSLIYHRRDQWDKAEELQVQILKTYKSKLGEDHNDTLVCMHNLATTYLYQKRWEESTTLLKQVIETRKSKFGTDHPFTLVSIYNLATTYARQRKWTEAEKLHKEVMDVRKVKLGLDHPHTLSSMHDLAVVWHVQDREQEAISLMRDCVKRRARVLGTGHEDYVLACSILDGWEAPPAGLAF